jgi:thymidylate kinase
VNRFIVIEGLDATGKSTLVEKLADELMAEKLECPPLACAGLRIQFDDCEPLQRRAFYRFTNLVASEQAKEALEHSDVVMDRFWTSTAAFSAMDDGFEHDVPLGQYPPEISSPDILILLIVDEENRLLRMSGRGEPETAEEAKLAQDSNKRKQVLENYLAFNPHIIDTSNLNPDQVLEAALDIIRRIS